MIDNRWHSVNEEPKVYLLSDTYFSENLLVKCKDTSTKGYYHMVAYKNQTANIWFNSLIEEEIKDEILEWKYIE